MLLAAAMAIVAIHQHIAPEHQRIATAFGQQATLQRLVFLWCQRVDIGLEFFIDNDIHQSPRDLALRRARIVVRWPELGALFEPLAC